MTVIRIGKEYATQVIGFAVNLVDRIVLAGLLLRVWGVDDFAAWSIAMSAAGLVSLFDFGVNLYFANRVLLLVEQGKEQAARAALRAGNLLMGLASLIGLGVVVGVVALFGTTLGMSSPSGTLWIAVAALSAAAAIRMAISVHMSLYRAHRQYARQTMLMAMIDTARIVATIAAVFIGAGFLTVSLAQFAVTLACALAILFGDSRRLFPDYRYAVGVLPAGTRKEAFHISLGYWTQSAPNTLLTYLPVFLLTGLGGNGVVIAQFVLMRTIGNFVRTGLQMFAVVLGQETARRIAIDDQAGLRQVYREAALFLGAQTACATGVLLAMGQTLFALWTAEPGLYDPVLLWLAVGPPLLMPSTTLALNMLATTNQPWPIALGRVAQTVLTLVLFVILPIQSDVLRLMMALAVGELIGFGFPISVAAQRINPAADKWLHLELLARSICCVALTFGAALGAARLIPTGGWPALAAGLIAGGIVSLFALATFGVDRSRRRSMFALLRNRLGFRIDGNGKAA